MRIITRDTVLEQAKMLRGTKIQIEKDFDFYTRRIRRELLPYMREARSNGQRAYLTNDKLRIEGRNYDLKYA